MTDNMAPNAANYAALTPLNFLARAAAVYPDRVAVVYGARSYTYQQFNERCTRLASALVRRGIGRKDTVAVMAPNIPPLLEAHYGVPMMGAVLLALNTRLDAAAIARMLTHSEAKLLIVDREYTPVVWEALKQLDAMIPIVAINDGVGAALPAIDYEAFLAEGDAEANWRAVYDEWDPIALNYTSGTSGDPRGVVYHHRGAFLNAMSNAILFGLNGKAPVYLWTLPMFHCNGWCFTWGVTCVAGTHVCLRRVEPEAIFNAIETHRVTHMCGAPIVLNMLVHHGTAPLSQVVEVATGGAAPPAAIIEGMELLGFHVTHLYGLTESFGPSAVCAEQNGWAELPLDERARLMARQGVPNLVPTEIRIDAPAGEMGEMLLRGNTVMKGYLKNPEATEAAFAGGWFHTGDLGVQHPDGYVEIKDRSKDIIITGGENVSSLEVEDVLYRHPGVLEAAVVAKPDPTWGEIPVAFVTIKPGWPAAQTMITSERWDRATHRLARDMLTMWCTQNLAEFKVPREFIFGPLPKTATGKIQKFELRGRFEPPPSNNGSETREVTPARAMIELQLIATWEKLLPGIGRRIQPSDNFFDLGGTSFAALRLSEEISQRFDRTLPLGVIFARPTIAQLAALIETGEEVGTSQSLVLLRAGVDRPVFFVHRMLLDLARALDTRRAIWSLSWGLGTQTHHHPVHALPASLEALAGHYVEEMRTLQPEGPYSLAGHSAGGVVAYEMAQQLRAAGETVEFLGLIDSSIAAHFDYRGLRHPLSRILGNLLRLPPRELINNFRRPPPQPEIESFDFWKAYEPRAYPGRVTLFRASTIASVTRQRIPVEQAWQVLAGTLDIIDVPGRHLSMIRPPYVGTLAAKLRECLNAA